MGIFSFIQSMLGPTPEQDAALAAVNQKQRGLDNSLAYFKPYANAGDAALGKYNDAIGMGDSAKAMADFQNSPDYKLNMNWALG